MSAAATTADAAVPVKKSKKKLMIMLLIGLVVVLSAGGGGLFYMKIKAAAQAQAEAEAGGEDNPTAAKAHSAAKPDLKHPPTFLALDPFVVNLADKDVDRYAQIGITLEVEDSKFADQLKGYMPALRNSVLMLLAHKTSRELLERIGKEQLAVEIKREALRTVGLEVDEPEPEAEDRKDASADVKPRAKAKAKTKTKTAPPSPIHNVHFSTFIIQ